MPALNLTAAEIAALQRATATACLTAPDAAEARIFDRLLSKLAAALEPKPARIPGAPAVKTSPIPARIVAEGEAWAERAKQQASDDYEAAARRHDDALTLADVVALRRGLPRVDRLEARA